jgi:iron complex transport system permease protein
VTDTAAHSTPMTRTRLRVRLGVMAIIATAGVAAVLLYDVPGDPSRRSFWLALEFRVETVGALVVVAVCQAAATVLFHTATGNRILTPSIMGFDALYVVMQTAMIFFFGTAGVAATDGVPKILVQSALMVGFATLLYGWLFAGRRGDLHIMLLVGVVLGVGFGSLSTVMQRLLTPSEFDVLAAQLFGNLANANPDYLPWAALIAVAALVGIHLARHRLDVLALGEPVATSLGLRYRREVLGMLVVVAVLISVSTTLVGPMTFFGFLVATLTYQLAGSSQHRQVIPFAVLLGIATLCLAYFVLRHVFSAGGLITVIIEFAGGLLFLIHLLRKGSL